MKSNHVITRLQAQYANSLYLRGDNTLAKAVADGVPVAQELQTPPLPQLRLLQRNSTTIRRNTTCLPQS